MLPKCKFGLIGLGFKKTQEFNMTIQMALVFGALIVQMTILLLLVFPLPFSVRKHLSQTLTKLSKNNTFTIGMWFSIALMGMQFVDCLNRLQRYRGLTSDSGFLTNEQLASKFYSQRNLYLTGMVMYLYLAIYTVLTIVRKLVQKESTYREAEGKEAKPDTKSSDGEVLQYKELIEQKEKDIGALKSQVSGLQKAYDELNPSKEKGKSE